MQEGLDEARLRFRVVQKVAGAMQACLGKGWLRAVRQAADLRVEEMARRLMVSRSEAFRLEKAEIESRITLKSLRRALWGSLAPLT